MSNQVESKEILLNSSTLERTYHDLTTPHVADALMRLGVPVRCAPKHLRPLWDGIHLVGRVHPVVHRGSVDVFLDAVDRSERGDVLVVDNGGRDDEACIGDLVALESAQAGLSGIVIWGLHRDSMQLRTIRLPIFSAGALPVGPDRTDEGGDTVMSHASCGSHVVTAADFVLADDDGVLFVPIDRAAEVAAQAVSIRDTERTQAARMSAGSTFREQSQFDAYRAAREADPRVTFRTHLRAIGGAIEE